MISKDYFLVKYFNTYFVNNDPMNGTETKNIDEKYLACY